MIPAPPTAEAVAEPTLPKIVLEPPVIPTEMRLDELQVKGTPVMMLPKLSVTVALMVVAVPVGTTKEVSGLFNTANVIFCTGQVTKL